MRFLAKLEKVDLFLKLIQTAEKIGKECVMLFNPQKIELILTSDVTNGMQVWSGMPWKLLFSEYKVESKNENQIAFDINLDNIHKALKSGIGSSEITIKLLKKSDIPVLSFIIESQGAQMMTITQDIPVSLLSPPSLAKLVEPSLPDPLVYIIMPPLKAVQKVVDHMKNMSDYMKIEANMAGQLVLSIETDNVTISTFYKNLEHPLITGREAPENNPDIQCGVKVDIKKFSRFLFSHIVGPTNVICCRAFLSPTTHKENFLSKLLLTSSASPLSPKGLVENLAVVFYVLLEDLHMTFYIPVILS